MTEKHKNYALCSICKNNTFYRLVDIGMISTICTKCKTVLTLHLSA